MAHDARPAHVHAPGDDPYGYDDAANPELLMLLQDLAESGDDLRAALIELKATKGKLRTARSDLRNATGELERISAEQDAAQRAMSEGHTRERKLNDTLDHLREEAGERFGRLEREHAASLAVLARVVGAVLHGGSDGVDEAVALLERAGLSVPDSVARKLAVLA